MTSWTRAWRISSWAAGSALALACAKEEPIGAGSEESDTSDSDDASEDSDGGPGVAAETEAAAGATSPAAPGGSCTTLRREALGQVDATATAEVLVLEENAGERLLYIDASAGGFQGAAQQPYVYVDLANGVRVDVSDFAADSDTGWDLAFKRFTIRTNSADSGPGDGGAAAYEAAFGDLSASQVNESDFLVDDFIDDDTCETALGDPGIGGIWTPFAGWYLYDGTTMVLTPAPLVFAVRGADGVSLYQLAISDYYGTPEGGQGPVSGRYLVRYAPL
jgi:hypothetical protein